MKNTNKKGDDRSRSITIRQLRDNFGSKWLTFCARKLGRVARQTPFMPRSVINTAIKSIWRCRLEACVREIDTWILLNKLKLNKDKTELLVKSYLHCARPPLSHIHVCDERVLPSPKVGNIGVLFDESLSMVPQGTAMSKSEFYHLRKIRLIRKHLTLFKLNFLFKLLLHQSLTIVICYYMVYLRTWLNSYNVCRMQLLVLLLVRPSSVILQRIIPVVKNLHWLPIDLRIEFKILTVTYETLHGLAPAYIKDLLQSYHPARDLRSSKKNLLAVPAFNIDSYGRHAFSVSAPLLWNSLPQHRRDAGSLNSWKLLFLDALF